MLEYITGVIVAIGILTSYLIFFEKMVTLRDGIKILGYSLLSWCTVIGLVFLVIICCIGIALDEGENIILWKKKSKK